MIVTKASRTKNSCLRGIKIWVKRLSNASEVQGSPEAKWALEPVLYYF